MSIGQKDYIFTSAVAIFFCNVFYGVRTLRLQNWAALPDSIGNNDEPKLIPLWERCRHEVPQFYDMFTGLAPQKIMGVQVLGRDEKGASSNRRN